MNLLYKDKLEFEAVYKEIFEDQAYEVQVDNPKPLIVDAGAHIGLATIYFHLQYPQARFICVEPDPENVVLLKKNLEANHVAQAEIIEAALAAARGEAEFWKDETWSVFSSVKQGGWLGERKGKSMKVKAIELKDVVRGKTDVLKMDIEGAETEVLEKGEQLLPLIDKILLEYHHHNETEREKLESLLRRHYSEVTFMADERAERNPRRQLYLVRASK